MVYRKHVLRKGKVPINTLWTFNYALSVKKNKNPIRPWPTNSCVEFTLILTMFFLSVFKSQHKLKYIGRITPFKHSHLPLCRLVTSCCVAVKWAFYQSTGPLSRFKCVDHSSLDIAVPVLCLVSRSKLSLRKITHFWCTQVYFNQ